MLKKLLFILFGIFLTAGSLYAQRLALPFIRSFTPKDYRAGAQNWAVVQDKRGVLYVGNEEGLLEYDGLEWRKIEVGSTVRSLSVNEQGQVFVGAQSEFGLLTPDSLGEMRFTSLVPMLPPEERKLSDVWRCFSTEEGIYFFTRRKIFRWNKGEFKIWNTRYRSPLNKAGDKIYHIERNKGLMTFTGDSLSLVKGGEVLANKPWSVFSILPWGQNRDQLLLCTPTDGLFIFDPNTAEKLRPFESEANAFLSNNSLYQVIELTDGRLVMASLEKGLLFLNKDGSIHSTMNKESGIPGNRILCLLEDEQGGLWIGSEYGISRAEIHQPLEQWVSDFGYKGSVYDIIRHKKELYVATGAGLFYLENHSAVRIEGIDNKVWDLLSMDVREPNGSTTSKLMAATGTGIYEIDPSTKTADLIGGVTPSFKFHRSEVIKNRFYAALNNGLVSLIYRDGEWIYEGQVDNITDVPSSMNERSNGNLWLGTQFGVLNVKFEDPANLMVEDLLRYDTLAGLPERGKVEITKFKDEVFFTTSKGVYKFDDLKQEFFPDDRFGKYFSEVRVSGVFADSRDNAWLLYKSEEKSGSQLAQAIPNQKGLYTIDTITFKRLPDMEISRSAVYPDSSGLLWIGSEEGLFLYRPHRAVEHSDFHALVREVRAGGDSLVFKGAFFENRKFNDSLSLPGLLFYQPEAMVPTLDYSENSLSFSFSASCYDASANLYSYKLEGYSDEWSEWSTATHKEFTNLHEGRYTFTVRSKNVYGLVSQTASYTFKIDPPIYRSWTAYGVYAVLVLVLIRIASSFNSRRLERERQRLEELVKERTTEIESQKEEIVSKNTQLNKQKEEILNQANDLMELNSEVVLQSAEIRIQKEQVEKAFHDIRVISEIGQKITALLDLKELEKAVYEYVVDLVDATVFGIGVYDEEMQRIEYAGAIEQGKKTPPAYIYLSDEAFSVYCLTTKEEILINNLDDEYVHYFESPPESLNDKQSQSLIFIPLLRDEHAIGVLTVQNFRKGAYSDTDLALLRNLATYASVAVDNANSYEDIKSKNIKITDSIRYAQTIQKAILPTDEQVRQVFPDFFVINTAKDIVSGDFYWFSPFRDKVFIACVDCTGHGVPGAFMSVVGNNILNKIINEKHYDSPSEVLELMNIELRAALRQDEKANEDGMDMSLCKIEYNDAKEKVKITFAGAKSSLYYAYHGSQDIHEFKGDRRSIGGRQRNRKPFKDKEVLLNRNDVMYLATDGFADQNDLRKRKFGSKRFKEALGKNSDFPMSRQKELLLHELSNHKLNVEQRDDITVIGLRL